VFAAASTNESQVLQYDLKFDVRLTQDTSGGSDGRSDDEDDSDGSDGTDGHDDDGLPGTGGLPWWVLPFGSGLTVGGVSLAALARKERTHG
jgi:hypothetical protein